MSTVEAASGAAGEYIAEAVRAQTHAQLRAIWTAAYRADLGEATFGLIAAAIMTRRAALDDRDQAQLALLERELGARLIGTRPPPSPGT